MPTGPGQSSPAEEFAGTPRSAAPGAARPAGPIQNSELSNGVRVVSRDTNAAAASVALYVGAGSRHETASDAGAAHFLGRMAFGSTKSRTHFRVVRDAEAAGVFLDGGASREAIMFAAEGGRDAVDDMVSFIAEAVTEPALAPWDVKEWAHTIERDLDTLEASPDVTVGEALHAAAFGDSSPLGHSLYAARHRLSAISPDVLRDYAARTFGGKRMVFAGTNVDHGELTALVSDALGGVEAGADSSAPASPYSGGEARIAGASPLVHVALAFEGAALNSSDLAAAAVLRALLGGEGAGSRLGAATAGDHSYALAASAFAQSYSDTGLFGVYGSALGSDAPALVDLLAGAVSDAASSNAAADELDRAKKTAKRAVFGVAETRVGGRDLLGLGTLAGAGASEPSAAAAAIDAVTAEQVKKFATALLRSGASLAAVGDTSATPRLSSIAGRFR